MKPSIAVHGGAWDIPDGLVERNIRGCERAAAIGHDVLESGASALDAAVEAVASMEDDPSFNAGVGAVLNQKGRVELDAMVMEGASLKFGAVAAIQYMRNPIRVAKTVLGKSGRSLIIGDGAIAHAEASGFARCRTEDLLVGRELDDYQEFLRTGVMRTRRHFAGEADTVGACAIDCEGHVACATSTGGIPRKHPGRVGDSPLVGCGGYADDRVGAASATGWGEQIMSVVLSKTALDLLAQHTDPMQSSMDALRVLEDRVNGLGGIIMVSNDGRIGLHHNTPRMAFAFVEGPTDRRRAAISIR